jgi:acetyltransferase
MPTRNKKKRSEALDPLFRPRSIAVIGASRRKGSIGFEITRNLINFEFPGAVYPVNPNAGTVHSIKCHPSVLAIQDEVDVAFVVVPSRLVLRSIEECGIKGVKAVVVITAGFREVGGEGAALEANVLEAVRRHGMRMLGPNCMGIINTHPDYHVNGTFARQEPLEGRVGFMSQSGALGVVLLDYAKRMNLGFSMFASVGNKADISGNDLVEYWENDPDTDVILLYLENFGNPRNFVPIARRVTRKKPIVVVKSGRTLQGAKAASSHTGALAGTMEAGVQALLEQNGILRANTVRQLFDMAKALAHKKYPAGNRLGIITNAGGPGVLLTDSVVQLGMQVPRFTEQTMTKLKNNLPLEATVTNPVDVIGSGNAESYRQALGAVADDPNVDALIVVFVPPVMVNVREVINAILEEGRKIKKPMVSCVMGGTGNEEILAALDRAGIPNYEFPDAAAVAMASLVRYAELRNLPRGKVHKFEVDEPAARKAVDSARARGGGWLNEGEVRELMQAYGVPFVPSVKAATADEAVEVASGMGYPVVLKVDSPHVIHKTDVGGVLVDVRTDDEIRTGFDQIVSSVRAASPDADVEGVIVQKMLKTGREIIFGMDLDPAFGPLMMVGLGGIFAETIKDVTFRIAPLSDHDAGQMIDNLRGVSFLRGSRGEGPVDFARIREILQRLSQMVMDFIEIEEFDINPFMAFPEGQASAAVDARVRIEQTPGS